MKKYKKLQKYADDSMSEYKNDAFLERLKSDLFAEKSSVERHGKRFYLMIAAVTCLVVTMILVSVFVFAPLINGESNIDKTQPPKYYAYENRTECMASVTELNDAVSDIEFSEKDLVEVRKITDNVYNETLYYIVKYELNEGLDVFKIIVDANADFDYDFGNKPYNKFVNVNGFEMAYLEMCDEGDGIYGFTCRAEIKNTKEKIYIEYDGISLEQKSNFLIGISCIIN